MATDNYDFQILQAKVVVVGNMGVGKTSIMKRYCRDSFQLQEKSTVGADFALKSVDVDDRSVSLEIWDTAGQEQYRALVREFYRGAQAGVIVFDLTNRESFDSLSEWLEIMRSEIAEPIPFVILGNKVDLKEGRKIKRDEAEGWCRRNEVLNYFETSAKDNINLEEAFLSVAREVIKFRGETSQDADTDGDRTVTLDGSEDQSRSRGCEC